MIKNFNNIFKIYKKLAKFKFRKLNIFNFNIKKLKSLTLVNYENKF